MVNPKYCSLCTDEVAEAILNYETLEIDLSSLAKEDFRILNKGGSLFYDETRHVLHNKICRCRNKNIYEMLGMDFDDAMPMPPSVE